MGRAVSLGYLNQRHAAQHWTVESSAFCSVHFKFLLNEKEVRCLRLSSLYATHLAGHILQGRVWLVPDMCRLSGCQFERIISKFI
jgi:hypothetical protein